jgi:predicted RNase H-like HicB family nuclease
MTFRLTKAELRAKQAHIETLREAERNLQSVIDSYAEAIKKASDWVQEVAEARRQEFNSRSTRWRDSVASERVSEWIDNWEQYEPELVELSSELASDALDQLPYEPD